MVTFCIGEAFIKRKEFFRAVKESGGGAVIAQTDEILAYSKLNGSLCAAVADVPYKNMICYSYLKGFAALRGEMLCAKKAGELLCAAGLKRALLNKKIKRLDSLELSLLSAAAKVTEKTGEVYLNLDFFRFNKKRRRFLRRAAEKLGKSYNLFIAVSDTRFVFEGAAVKNYGEQKITRVRTARKGPVIRNLKKKGIAVNFFKIKRVYALRDYL